MQQPLSSTELEEALSLLSGWEATEKSLHRHLEFANFQEAFAFMQRVAIVAEELGHHPDWHNVFNRLDIVLSTHESGGITEKDIELAQRINRLLEG